FPERKKKHGIPEVTHQLSQAIVTKRMLLVEVLEVLEVMKEGFLEQHKPAVDAAIRQAIDKLKTLEQGTSSAGICEDRKNHGSKEWK
ncbi:hypothetical protein Tco_1044718, partial [Tanacetum coccineum]